MYIQIGLHKKLRGKNIEIRKIRRRVRILIKRASHCERLIKVNSVEG